MKKAFAIVCFLLLSSLLSAQTWLTGPVDDALAKANPSSTKLGFF